MFTKKAATVVWKATSIIAVILSFCFGPLYGVKIQKYFQETGHEDTEGEFEISELIAENQEYGARERILRYVISSFLAVLLLAVSIGVTFALVLIRENTDQNLM